MQYVSVESEPLRGSDSTQAAVVRESLDPFDQPIDSRMTSTGSRDDVESLRTRNALRMGRDQPESLAEGAPVRVAGQRDAEAGRGSLQRKVVTRKDSVLRSTFVSDALAR